MNGLKNLIMGACIGRPFRDLEPFIASLRRIGFAGDVCVFVEDVTIETVELLRAHGVRVERTGPSSQPSMTASSSCYFSYLDFLLRHHGDYACAMVADPTAVVFQSDPFATLTAEIVYTQERCRIGDSAVAHQAVVQAYGEGVATNIRDFMAASPLATLGTCQGMLHYLFAMTHQLGGRTTPVTSAMHVGVHNYIVRMHPLRGAWVDPVERISAAVDTVPAGILRISDDGALVEGRKIPVLCNWEGNATCRDHIRQSPRYRLDESMRGAWPSVASVPPAPSSEASADADAVLAYYDRRRDADWLPLFLSSLRGSGANFAVHCLGDFDDNERALLARYNCTAHQVPATELQRAENVAHFFLSQVLDRLAEDAGNRPGQVLLLDAVRAVFVRDPFERKTPGISLFCEGPTRVVDSDYNRDRLAFFVPPDQARLSFPIVSCSVLRGPLPLVRKFYHHLFIEFVGRSDLLGIHKVVQGVFNKFCHATELGIPIMAYPNGAEVYFDFWRSDLAIDTRHGVHVGGSVPALVLGAHTETALMMKLRLDLGLRES